jgi:hypothetical protein
LLGNWFNFNLQNVGDREWGVVCGRRATRNYYGKPLNGNGNGNKPFAVEQRDGYPSIDELKELSSQSDAFAFVIWNTRKKEFVAKQFELAGKRLLNVPDYLRDYFSISMVNSCFDVYVEGQEETALEWAKELTPPAQVEMMKQIYKVHYKNNSIERLSKQCEQANLPMMAEIYNCRVDAIQLDKQTAWVELRHLDSSQAVSMERFDLKQLIECGIDHESQRFEYFVYREPYGHLSMGIEPIESQG